MVGCAGELHAVGESQRDRVTLAVVEPVGHPAEHGLEVVVDRLHPEVGGRVDLVEAGGAAGDGIEHDGVAGEAQAVGVAQDLLGVGVEVGDLLATVLAVRVVDGMLAAIGPGR